jgi:hypothetical protein
MLLCRWLKLCIVLLTISTYLSEINANFFKRNMGNLVYDIPMVLYRFYIGFITLGVKGTKTQNP